jgi:hypothetical protein
MPIQAQSTNTAPAIGIGAYGNVGWGSLGWTAVPGLSFVVGSFPIGFSIGFQNGYAEYALSADWLAFKFPFVKKDALSVSGYLGPGLYGALAIDPSGMNYGVGIRAVAGCQAVFEKTWQVFASIVPAFGIISSNTSSGTPPALNANADVEIGVRYLINAR